MRVLAVPMLYTDASVSGVSVIANLAASVTAAAELELPEYWEIVVASRPSGYGSQQVDWLKRPRVSVQPLGDVTDVNEDPPVSWDMLRPLLPRKGRVVFDVVLNNRYLHSATIANTLQVPPGKWYQTIEIPVVTWLTETGLDKREWQLNSKPGVALLTACAMTGPFVVMNQADADWLTGVLDREALVYVVPPCADLSRLTPEKRRRDRRVVFHGGSIEGRRRLKALHDALPAEADLLLTSQQTFSPGAFPRARTISNVDHEEYLRLLPQGDIVYVGSEYEGTGLGWMEAIASGMLPVLLDAGWMAARLPAGYPLQARTPGELRAVLARAVAEYDELWDEWMPKVLDGLAGFQPAAVAQRMHDTLAEIAEPARKRNLAAAQKWSPGFDLLARAVEAEGWSVVTDARPLWKAMSRQSRTGLEPSWYSPAALRWMLMALGYEDRHEQSGLDLRREDAARA
jgi:hypothetical protein